MADFVVLSDESDKLEGNDPYVALLKLKCLSNAHIYVCKYCNPQYSQNQEIYKKYYEKFKNEYEHMKNLERTMIHLGTHREYLNYFPKYIQYDGFTSAAPYPYIIMEFVEGDTLDHRLRNYSHIINPHDHLTPRQIRHLMDQIYHAQELLFSIGMLQLDLNPKNIIIQNSCYDLKLIDFTDAYYISEDITESKALSPRRIDLRLAADLPIERQLQFSIADLFTRLFYSGSDRYAQFRRRHGERPPFFNKYGSLLDCLEQREPLLTSELPHDLLHYWNLWYSEFHRYF